MADRRWRSSRKTLLGVSLIAAPLLILVSDLLTRSIYDDKEAVYLANIAENEARYYAGNLIGVVGALFIVGAVLALIHLVRHRYPRYATGVGAFALIGALMMSGVWMVFTIVEYQMAQQANRGAMVALLESAEESATMIPLFFTWIGTMLGTVLLAAGLLRAGTIPRWMPALLIVGFVLAFPSEGALAIVANAVLLVGMGSIGLAILRSPLEAWESGRVAAGDERPVDSGAAAPATS